MTSRLLLDTHIVIRWRIAPHRLSHEQRRVLRLSEQRHEPLAVSDITLLESALLLGDGSTRLNMSLAEMYSGFNDTSMWQVLPITVDVAMEIAAIGKALPDPMDRAIVATARVHGLRLVTSDQRIAESRIVPIVG